MKMLLTITVLLFLSCAEEKKKDPTSGQPLLDKDQIVKLQSKFDLYKKLSAERLDNNDWIVDTKCDGLLFQSLYSQATGKGNPLLSEDPSNEGKFYRHHTRSCYQNHLEGIPDGSSSENSRDQYIGLFNYIISQDKKEVLANIIAYGEQENWIMGRADSLGAVEFRPDTIGHVYSLQNYYSLGDSKLRFIKPSYSKCKDFACHLRALIIWQRHSMEIYEERDRKALFDLTEYDNRNALFLALYATFENSRTHMQKAYQTLMNEQWFPNDRLPRSTDRCGFYIFERGPESNAWIPCKAQGKDKGDQEWSGIDFLITAHLILEGK